MSCCDNCRCPNPEELQGDSTGFAGGGDANAAAAIVETLANLPLVIGATLQMGFATEYDLVRRGQLLAQVIPDLLDALVELYRDRAILLDACDDSSLPQAERNILCARAVSVQEDRQVEPFLLAAPQVDDSLALEAWVERLRVNAGARGPFGNPPNDRGGNIRETQRILGRLFDEALFLTLIPPIVLLAQSGSHLTAQQAVRAAITTVFRTRAGLGYVYGADPDAQDGRIPWPVRQAVLGTLTDYVAAGLSPSLLVPSWAFGFRVDGSDAPPVEPTIGAYLLASELVASGQWPPPPPEQVPAWRRRAEGGELGAGLGVGGQGGLQL